MYVYAGEKRERKKERKKEKEKEKEKERERKRKRKKEKENTHLPLSCLNIDSSTRAVAAAYMNEIRLARLHCRSYPCSSI